jgi:hypothetical protein
MVSIIMEVIQEEPVGIMEVIQEEPVDIMEVIQEEPVDIMEVIQEEPVDIMDVIQEEPVEDESLDVVQEPVVTMTVVQPVAILEASQEPVSTMKEVQEESVATPLKGITKRRRSVLFTSSPLRETSKRRSSVLSTPSKRSSSTLGTPSKRRSSVLATPSRRRSSIFATSSKKAKEKVPKRHWQHGDLESAWAKINDMQIELRGIMGLLQEKDYYIGLLEVIVRNQREQILSINGIVPGPRRSQRIQDGRVYI